MSTNSQINSHSNARFSSYLRRARESDLMGRPGLSPTERYAVIVGAITALPLSADEQEKEFKDLLGDGCAADLAEDIIIQMAAYLGYPRASQALRAYEQARHAVGDTEASEFKEPQDVTAEARYARGIEDYAQLNPDALTTIKSAFGEISEDFIHMTFQAFGDVFASSGQPLSVRQLATLSALAVVANAAPQLRFHMNAAFHVGVRPEQVVEVIAWTQFFAGMPAAYNAMVELKSALADGAAPAYQ